MKRNFLKGKKEKLEALGVLTTALVVAVTVLANTLFSTLANRYALYSDMTEESVYAVTNDCFSLLENAFFEKSGTCEMLFCSAEATVRTNETLNAVLENAEELAERFPDRLTVRFCDILTNPTAVADYAKETDAKTGEVLPREIATTSVILIGEEYYRIYDLEEFYSFHGGDSSDVWAYNGEKKLAAGILRALSDESRIVCLTSNHGETYYDFELLYLLDDAGYTVEYLDLSKDEIPKDCHLILSYNPNSDLLKNESTVISEPEILDRFLSDGNNHFFLFVENGTPELPNFEELLSGYGVGFSYVTDPATGKKYRTSVSDTSASLTSDGLTIYGQSASDLFDGISDRVVFKNATALTAAQGFVNQGDGTYVKGNMTLRKLFESAPSATGIANGKTVSGGASMLMTLTEIETGNGLSSVCVASSTAMAEEAFLQSAVYRNSDALLRLCRIFGGDVNPEGLSPKPLAGTDISSVTTAQIFRWTAALVALPALLLTAVGIFVLIRRKNRI